MKKNIYSNERLSFARPNAESTMNTTFQWGRKDFNNSSISQDKSAKSPQKTLNMSKIDSRIYTDVQSRGLASRIVKYHENGTSFNRSVSLTNLCGKTSPLSVKKLEAKPQLKYDKAIKQNVSMTHIAPPEKSLFYGNTLSGLLRSSSVINLKQNEDNLSSENRPIIHPPVTEKELQPTRSVLEELKEISRKRINNEVLQDNDDTIDTSKKYCGRLIDTSAANFGIGSNDYRSQQQQQIHAQTQLPTTSVYKRQRESAVDGGYVPSSHINAANSLPPKPLHHNEQLAASPEQQSKRRHCNYNNDITSSLSSSVKNMTTGKRKLFEHDGYKRQEKLLRYQSDIRLPSEVSAALNYGNQYPITPLPNTPQTNFNEIPSHSSAAVAYVQKSASAPLPVTAADSTHSTQQSSEDASSGSSGVVAVKPKLTLFNRDYETKKTAVELELNEEKEDSNDDDNAYAGINFVKPKKSTNSIGGNTASNLVMQRTRKSKLALMLSGLRGELYLGDEEEEQRVSENEKLQNNAAQQQQQQPTTMTTTLLPTNQQNTNLTDKPDGSLKSAAVTLPLPNDKLAMTISKPGADSALTQPTKITSPLLGIKLTPQTTLPNTLNFAAPSTTATANDLSAAKSNFSLGAPASTAAVSTATTTASFSFGVPSSLTATKTATILPFATTTSTNTTTVGSSTATVSTGSTFNLNSTSAATALTSAAVTTSTPAATLTFSAGLNFSSNAATTPAKAITTFGDAAALQKSQQHTSTTLPAANTTTKPAASAGSFNFTNKPTDGAFTFGSNTIVTAQTSQNNEAPKMFSFSASTKAAANPTVSSGAFTFGSNSSTNAALDNKKAQTVSPFGSATPQPANDQTKTQPTTNSFMFGGVAKPAIQTETAFGLTTTQNKETNNTTTANSFVFASGGVGGSSNLAAKPNFGSATNNSEINSVGLFGFKTVVNNNTTISNTTTTNENAKPPSNIFLFKNPAASAAQPTTKAAFNFGVAGSGNITNINSSSDSTKSSAAANLFGTALGNANQQSKTFTFGSQNVAPAALTTSSEPVAANKPAANTFNFSNVSQNNNTAFVFAGGNSNNDAANSNKSTNSNTFGGLGNANSNKPSGGFNFNPTPNAGIFNFNATQKSTNNSNNVSNNQTASNPNANATTATNSFGAFSSSNNQSSTGVGGGGGFVFGAKQAPNSTNASSVFGATHQQNNTNNNLFAIPASASTQPAAGNLFAAATNATSAASNIFGSTSNATSTPVFGSTPAAPAPNTGGNNIFAVPATSGSDRPIRRATRRLAKP